MKNKKAELEKRRELLKGIFDRVPGEPIFDKMLDFYRSVFLQNPDLIVCMCRKSWCVVHLFLPFLESEGIIVDTKKLTHDRMVHPWFSEFTKLDPNKCGSLKVFVIDDTFQTGRAIDECIRRLILAYAVQDLTVAVFAMADDKRNRERISGERYTVYESPSHPGIKPFEVKWNGKDVFYTTRDNVSAFSNFFVEALHAFSEPYVGYIPAFRLPLEVVKEKLGAYRGKEIALPGTSDIRVHGYLEQDDFNDPFSEPGKMGYYNITSQQMRQNDVEAFYFSSPVVDSDKEEFLPSFLSKNAISIAALRFYLNSETGFALIVPYLSLKDCYADKDIVEEFPEKLKALLINKPTEKWEDSEEQLAAYRLIRYAAGYLWGKQIIKDWFELKVNDENLASNGGICSQEFFNWLSDDNDDSAKQDIARIWSFFDPEKGNVVEEKQSMLPKAGADFVDVIDKSLSVSDIVDYYGTVSMMFRHIFIKEREMLEEYEKNKRPYLPPPFCGFPINVFFYKLLEKFPELKARRDVLVTVTLMLCDMGVAVTQLYQRNGVIGTVLFNGEQSCHALAPIAPEYARFLSDFPGLLRGIDKERHQEKIEMVKSEIRKYFEDERDHGIERRLSINELMSLFDDFTTNYVDDPNQKFYAYSALPRTSFFDYSELFFWKLREKLTS